MNTLNIFEPQVSKIARGLEGKVIFLYGPNSTGKTYQTVRMEKPLVLACENGLNAQSGVKFFNITTWSMFTKAVRDLTSEQNIAKAKEMYSTIIIDEVYASALLCQKFVCDTYGEGCISLGANPNSKVNLYQVYERIYWEQINKLSKSGYTVVFIGHAAPDPQTGYVTPKGDKRMVNPICDNSDLIIYLKPAGIDAEGKVIKSTAYTATTNEFFARSRFEYMDSTIPEFTAEKLADAIDTAIKRKEEHEGVKAVTYEEQKAEKEKSDEHLDYTALMKEINENCMTLAKAGLGDKITNIVEGVLGVGQKVSACNEKQVEAMAIILDQLKEAVAAM